jgi:hypothetical protein
MHVTIYKPKISSRIAPESPHGLYRVTLSPHTTDLSDDNTLMADCQVLLQPI